MKGRLGERFRQNPGGARRRGEGGSILKPPPAVRPTAQHLRLCKYTAGGVEAATGLPKRRGAAAVTASWRLLQQVAFLRLLWREGPLGKGKVWKSWKGGWKGSLILQQNTTQWLSLSLSYTTHTDPTLSRLCWGRNQRHLFEINCSIQSHLCTYLCQGWPSPTAGKRFG